MRFRGGPPYTREEQRSNGRFVILMAGLLFLCVDLLALLLAR